jgi:hypothetical protein
MGENITSAALQKMDIPVEELGDFPLTDVDRAILAMTDDEYKLHDWDELGEIIGRFLRLVY